VNNDENENTGRGGEKEREVSSHAYLSPSTATVCGVESVEKSI
jgi:hypothetical protein